MSSSTHKHIIIIKMTHTHTHTLLTLLIHTHTCIQSHAINTHSCTHMHTHAHTHIQWLGSECCVVSAPSEYLGVCLFLQLVSERFLLHYITPQHNTIEPANTTSQHKACKIITYTHTHSQKHKYTHTHTQPHKRTQKNTHLRKQIQQQQQD